MVRATSTDWRNGDGDRSALMAKQPCPIAYAKALLSHWKEFENKPKPRPIRHMVPYELVLSKEERAKAVQATLNGEKLPDSLRHKVAAYLSLNPQPKRKRGRKTRLTSPRNSNIYNMITLLKKNHGLRATRNRATETPSAASIVSEALRQLGVRLSETQINRIHDDLHHFYHELDHFYAAYREPERPPSA
jgi:hypothetical protein